VSGSDPNDCTHAVERGSTITQVTDDRYECTFCGEQFKLVSTRDAAPRAATEPQLKAALARAIEAGYTDASIDADLYQNDPVYHAVVYEIRRHLLAGDKAEAPRHSLDGVTALDGGTVTPEDVAYVRRMQQEASMSEPTLNITLNEDAEPTVIDLGGGVVVTFDSDEHATVRHPAPEGFWLDHHTAGVSFPPHVLVSKRPLTITPSLFCTGEGGCGWHVFITDGAVR
jgi:hypothetical protein